MDSIISLGQKNTLAEYMILSGADNRPPMLDKDLYDSWKSRMELYIQNREHGRMILESVENGPLIWPTIEENGVIRTKKYVELSAAEKIQADWDMKATNIILQGLLADIYSLVNHHRVAKDLWKRVQLLMQGASLTKQERECKLYDAFDKFTHIKGESLHTYYLRFTQLINDMNIYKMKMEQFQVNTKFLNSLPPEWSKFVTDVKLVKDLHTSNFDQLHAYLEQHELHANEVRIMRERNQDPLAFGRMLLVQGEIQQVDKLELLNATTAKVKDIWLGNALRQSNQGMQHDPEFQQINFRHSHPLTSCFQTEDLDIDFEQSPVMDFTDNEISSDSNIIPYSQYLQETQQATIQDTNLQAQQDSMILSVIEQIYKERVKTFEQRLNIDLSSREKMIDSQMDDMIREKLALKEQIDSLEQNLSKQIKEKESLFKTFTVFKNESKEKENKYLENEIDLEKKIKELDNIVYKVGQSAQTVHMLTKPQAFYDNTHKQALGYQNPFYLKKAQRIKPTLYDGAVMSKTHVAMPVIDDEETLILEEESRSKMFEKAKDPEVIAKKISHKPIDYEKLNSLTDDFGKRFSPQQELSAEQAFWFHTLNPTIEPSYTPPVIVDVPSELPKVSLVNASLKKLKFHLTQFDSVVKKRTTPSALEEGEWGFEHTKTIFNNEIIPFLKSLKDIFNVFDKDLLNEITEVQTVFDQMEASVQQFSVDKKCLEIAKKEILLENDRLLQKVMSQDVLLIVMNSMSLNNGSVNMKMQKCELCEKCLNLDAELSKSKQAYNDLLKNYSQLEKHCISLEVSMQLKQEVFQNDDSYVSQNVVEIPEYFEINDLKARLQDKDTTICKLKDTIKSLRENTKEENIDHEKWEIEPINKELENSVAKLLSENERLCNEINHVKQVFKDQFDSIKQTRVRHKEQSDSLINKLNLKYVENEDLKAQIQDKLDLELLPPRLLQNREVHIDYLRNTQEQANILREIVEQAKAKKPLDSELDLACNKRNDRISQTPSRNKKNKVEAQPKKVNRVVKPVCDVDVKHSLSNANSEILCATCNKSMFDGVHDNCLLDLVQNGNKRCPGYWLDSGTTDCNDYGVWSISDGKLLSPKGILR
ncbi:hypothetical protein Tco_0971682 [Tanacetum coccineum]